MLKVIAIDDEPLALRQINSYISQNPLFECVATFENGLDALEYINQNRVDLIFSDIEMPDINGVELVKQLPYQTMVVFTTAYSEYAIEGYRLNIIDYLLKPFSLADFSRAATKAIQLYNLVVNGNNEAKSGETNEVQYISVKSDYKNIRIDVSTIKYVMSDGEYVRIVMEDGSTILSLIRLKNMEIALPASTFIRVHRSYIVNKTKIKSYAKGRVELLCGHVISVGDNYKEDFLKMINDFPRAIPKTPSFGN